jgi:hypothetical protein
VRVHEIAVDARRSTPEGPEEEGHREDEPGPSSEIADDAVAVRETEVPKRGRRDDVDPDAAFPNVLDGVSDESPRDVIRMPRVRRRQDEDVQARLAKTTGSASASATKA